MINAVINAHREGVMAGPSLNSFHEAVQVAVHDGHNVSAIAILDRADDTTHAVFEEFRVSKFPELQLHMTDLGDPGLARNAAVAHANGDFVTFLDADDLWSFNWLVEAHRTCEQGQRRRIVHSEVNVTFGNEAVIWWHPNSEHADCDISYLRLGNYWDALAFADIGIYRRLPFVANNLSAGYGHEDWHWNCATLAEGYPHVPAPGTIHFKRRRAGSQMAICDSADVVIWPNAVASYAFSTRDLLHATSEAANKNSIATVGGSA